MLVLLLFLIFISFSFEQKVIDLITTSTYHKRYPKIASTEYFPKIPDELFMIEVNIGTPSQAFHLLVDTTALPMWIQSKDSQSKTEDTQATFDQTLSTSYQSSNTKVSFNYKDNTCTAELITDRISIGSLKEFTLEFPLVKDYSSSLIKMDGILGLSRGPQPNEKFQLTHSVIRNSQGYDHPEKNVFSLHFFDSSVPKLFIGKEHSDFSMRNQIGSCEAVKMMNNYWGCMVTQILFNETSIPIGTEVIFDTSIEKIYFPAKLKRALMKIVSQKHCREIEEDDGTSYFSCNSLIDYVPFYLALGETVLKLPKVMFIHLYESSHFYNFKVNFSPKYNEIRLGTSIFKYYHVLFDEKNKKIKFYVENKSNIASLKDFKIVYKESSMNSCTLIAVLVVGFILSSSIIIKVVRNKKKGKKKRAKDFDESITQQMTSYNAMKAYS